MSRMSRTQRDQLNLSQYSDAELAALLGINRTTAWRLRTGRSQPGPKTIKALRVHMKIDIYSEEVGTAA